MKHWFILLGLIIVICINLFDAAIPQNIHLKPIIKHNDLIRVISVKISDRGIQHIKNWEGFSSKAYKVHKGEIYYTIGYGHYGKDVKPNQIISKDQAEVLLREDLKRFEKAVNEYVKVPLNQNQYDALVSFAYNNGTGAFKTSTLLKELNKGNYNEVPNQMKRWVWSGGVVMQGLKNRRKSEISLWKEHTENVTEVAHNDIQKHLNDMKTSITNIENELTTLPKL